VIALFVSQRCSISSGWDNGGARQA